MDPRYEQETVAVEDRHWWYVGRRRILEGVVKSLALPVGAEILDAGCGSGCNLEWLARFGAMTGLELSDDSLEYARQRGVGSIVAGSVEEIPLPDESFDLVTSFDVIEHVDDRRALRELHRVLRPGGHLLVSVPAYPFLWSEHDARNHHRRRYTVRTLLEVALATGFDPRWSSHFNLLLLPAAAAHRLIAGFSLPPEDGARRSEFELTSGWLNPLLRLPLEVEAALLRVGARIPAGLSLMALFAK